MSGFTGIKNIVFDLGGVIINLDFNKTFNRFAELAKCTAEETISKFEKEEFFKRFETGMITEQEFFEELKEKFCPGVNDEQIRDAWNALLLDLPAERIDFIKSLRGKYNLYLLSNTNDTRIQKVNEILNKSCGENDLRNLFDKVYYSYEINLAKPYREIYDYVCADCKLNPEETVFLDDTYLNLEGAIEAGWKVLHVKHPLTIFDLLKNA